MIKFLLFCAGMSLLFPLACGCTHAKPLPTAVISQPSPSDLYMCGYMTPEDKKADQLKCAPHEVWLEYFLPLVAKDMCKPGGSI